MPDGVDRVTESLGSMKRSFDFKNVLRRHGVRGLPLCMVRESRSASRSELADCLEYGARVTELPSVWRLNDVLGSILGWPT